jgi:hypothetical protein
MKHTLVTICFVTLSASVANADLRYTTRVEVRRSVAQSAGRVDVGAVQALGPAGDTVTFVSADAVRIEHSSGNTKSILLWRPDGPLVLDPDERTYRPIPELREALASARSLTPPRFRRTGEFAMVLGVRTERVDVTMSLPLPTTPPPGFPTVIEMSGELWLADVHRALGEGLRKTTGLTGGLSAGIEGIVLRQIVRNAQLGIEIESTVTDLVEGPIAAEIFEVPSGYRRRAQP